MITDDQTNHLYLADALLKKHCTFALSFEELLKKASINYTFLAGTRDVWCRDYMPIQVSDTKFVQFRYAPDYLMGSKRWRDTISDVDAICQSLHINPVKSSLVVDGGNIVRSSNKVIMTDKVFRENKDKTESEMIYELERLLEVDNVIFIPQDPHDEIGHADGMVRFIDSDTVLINDYSRDDYFFQLSFRNALRNAGLNLIELPYAVYNNQNDLDATGIYINYLKMHQRLIVPSYGLPEDDMTLMILGECFPETEIVTSDCRAIAKHGGVLNCISWATSMG